VFYCTQHLRGRLYPSPATPDLFILELIDLEGLHVHVTNLTLYDMAKHKIPTQGSLPIFRNLVDLYTIGPWQDGRNSDRGPKNAKEDILNLDA
jgi:hypothetical protein